MSVKLPSKECSTHKLALLIMQVLKYGKTYPTTANQTSGPSAASSSKQWPWCLPSAPKTCQRSTSASSKATPTSLHLNTQETYPAWSCPWSNSILRIGPVAMNFWGCPSFKQGLRISACSRDLMKLCWSCRLNQICWRQSSYPKISLL